MVCGAFSERGTSQLAFLNGNQTQDHYKDTLSTYLLPFLNENGEHRIVQQNDNAPIKKTVYFKNWLEENGITAIDWPAKSPEFTYIEKL